MERDRERLWREKRCRGTERRKKDIEAVFLRSEYEKERKRARERVREREREREKKDIGTET